MYIEDDNNKIVNCTVIKVEPPYNIITRSINDIVDKNPITGYYYNVRNEEVQEYIEFIKELYEKYGLVGTKVYIYTFKPVSAKMLATREKIVNDAIFEVKRMKRLTDEKTEEAHQGKK